MNKLMLIIGMLVLLPLATALDINFSPSTTPNATYINNSDIFVNVSVSGVNALNNTIINLYNTTGLFDNITFNEVTPIIIFSENCDSGVLNSSWYSAGGIIGRCNSTYALGGTYSLQVGGGISDTGVNISLVNVTFPVYVELYSYDYGFNYTASSSYNSIHFGRESDFQYYAAMMRKENSNINWTYYIGDGSSFITSGVPRQIGKWIPIRFILTNESGLIWVNISINNTPVYKNYTNFNSTNGIYELNLGWGAGGGLGGFWDNLTIYSLNSIYNSSHSKNFTTLPRGRYYYNATVTDLLGINNTPTFYADIVGNFSIPYYNVTVKYPPGTYTNDTTFYIIGNTTDPYFYNWTFTLNNQTNSSMILDYRIDYIGLTDQIYYGNITATDLALNTYLWQTNFTVDTIPPTINFSNGTTPNNSVVSQSNIYINITVNETNINTTAINLYDEFNILINTSSNLFYNFTNLPNGRYYYNATVTDLVGYAASTETWTTYVLENFSDNLYNVTFPYNNNAYTTNTTLTYGFNTTDPYYNYTLYNITRIGAGGIYAFCFQESANVTNQTGVDGNCGLNYSGMYSISTAWNDGNYSSFEDIDNIFRYVNYTKPSSFSYNPSNTIGALWQVKVYDTPLTNYSISSLCLDQDPVQFRIETSSFLGGSVAARCWNGASWSSTIFSVGFGNSKIYEESIYWSVISNDSSIQTNDTSHTFILIDGKYYYDLTIFDQAGNNQYYDPNITIDTTPPIINFTNATETNGSTIDTRQTVVVAVNTSDTNYNYTIINLYNATGLFATYTNNISGIINNTFTTNANGWYYFNATTYDLAGNYNNTLTYQVYLDYYKNNITVTAYEKISNAAIPFNIYFIGQQNTTNYTVNDGGQAFVNTTNAFDNDNTTFAQANGTGTSVTPQLGKIFNQSTYVNNIYYMYRGQMADGGTNTMNIYLESYDNLTWTTLATLFTLGPQPSAIDSGILSGTYNLNSYTYGLRIRFNIVSSSSPFAKNAYIYELQPNTTYNGQIIYNFSTTSTLTVNNISKGTGTYDILLNTSYGLGGYNYCMYTNWTAQSDYIFPACEFYNHILNITAYNSYTGTGINTFTTLLTEDTNIYNETQSTINGTIQYDILQGLEYNILLSPDAHLNRSVVYNATGPTGTLNLSANQSIITVNFYHAFTNELINNANITLNDTSYVGKNFNTSNGTIIFTPNSGAHNLTAASSHYSAGTYNLLVTGEDIMTINFTLFPILNLTIYDEKLSGINLTYFNFSKPSQMKYTEYCTAPDAESQITVQQIISNTTPIGPYLLNTTCDVSKLRFDLIYNNIDGSTTAYHRIIVLAATIDLFSFKIFIPELSTTTILQTFLKPNDILGIYTVEANTQIRVTKLMPTGTELMLADYMDAEGKITAYLIQGDSYIITVLADGVPAKVVGPYSADSTGTKLLRLYDVGLIDPTIDTQSNSSLTDVQYYNISETQTLLTMSYRDAGNFTQTLNMTIYNGSCNDKSNILMQSILAYDDLNTSYYDADMSYNILNTSRYMNGSANIEQCAVWDIHYFDGSIGSREQSMLYDSWIPKPGTFTDPWTFPWIVMLVLVIIALGLNARTVSMGSLVIMTLAGILYGWNWIQSGTPGVTSSIVFGLALLIAIGLAFKRNVI